jgi:hypothetical protein
MNIKTEITDVEALRAACQRLGYELKESGSFRLYSSNELGAGVMLPGWSYPVVIREDGTLAMDNYAGRWGDISELHKLEAYYGLEKAKLEAWKKGYSIQEDIDAETQELVLQINLEV